MRAAPAAAAAAIALNMTLTRQADILMCPRALTGKLRANANFECVDGHLRCAIALFSRSLSDLGSVLVAHLRAGFLVELGDVLESS